MFNLFYFILRKDLIKEPRFGMLGGVCEHDLLGLARKSYLSSLSFLLHFGSRKREKDLVSPGGELRNVEDKDIFPAFPSVSYCGKLLNSVRACDCWG